jgi:hypothetical protein
VLLKVQTPQRGTFAEVCGRGKSLAAPAIAIISRSMGLTPDLQTLNSIRDISGIKRDGESKRCSGAFFSSQGKRTGDAV